MAVVLNHKQFNIFHVLEAYAKYHAHWAFDNSKLPTIIIFLFSGIL
jgi:hypothetical protein